MTNHTHAFELSPAHPELVCGCGETRPLPEPAELPCQHRTLYWINRTHLNWRCTDQCGFQQFGVTPSEARREARLQLAAMSHLAPRPLHHRTLGYARIAPGVWQHVDLHDPADMRQVGPQYATKAALLADTDRYALESWGIDHQPHRCPSFCDSVRCAAIAGHIGEHRCNALSWGGA